MNKQVENNGNPRYTGVSNELGVAQESSGTVVVGMQKCQGLLLQDQKDSINEFKVLGQVVHVVNGDDRLSPGSLVANGVKDTMTEDNGDQLLDKQQKQQQGEGGEEKVVNLEQEVKLFGLEVVHDLATTENHHVIDGNGGQSRGSCGERKATLDEFKRLGVPA